MRIRLQPFNPLLGAPRRNAERIVQLAEAAAKDGVDLLALPGWALTGAPLDDLGSYPCFAEAVAEALAELERRLPKDICTVTGVAVPDWDGLKAGAVALGGGAWLGQAYESGRRGLRWGGHEAYRGTTNDGAGTMCGVEVGGVRVGILAGEADGVTESEEAWDVCVQLVAEPYCFRPRAGEQTGARAAAAMALAGAPVLRVNLLGGHGDLVFDGGTWTPEGEGPKFIGEPLDVDVEAGGRMRRVGGRRGRALFSALAGSAENPVQELYCALALGIRDYAQKNGFKAGALVSLSGGIDSALVAALAVDALGAEHVLGVTLPSTVTSAETWNDAKELARRLKIPCPSLAIEPLFKSFHAVLDAEGAGYAGLEATGAGVADENLQARIRGALVMTLSNRYSRLVLATSNFSESMTGYATLYGDMCGGLAPILRIPKTVVFALAKWRNTLGEVIPPSTLARPPSAELRPGQRDSDSLPDYPTLDGLLERHLAGKASRAELVAAGLSEAAVDRVVRLARINEFKRRQAPMGIEVDPLRRLAMPVSHGFEF